MRRRRRSPARPPTRARPRPESAAPAGTASPARCAGRQRSAAGRPGPLSWAPAHSSVEQAGALLQVGRGLGPLQARRVGVVVGAATGGRTARGAGDPFQEAAKAAALPGFEQFERVDAEFLEQIFDRLRAGGRGEALLLVDPAEGQLQLQFDLFVGRFGRGDGQFGVDFADDVVVADVEVDVGFFDRLRDFVLGFFEFADRQRAGRFQLRAAGGVFDQLDHRVDRPVDAEVAADFGRRGAVDVGAAVVDEVVGELAELDPFRRLLAGGDVLIAALLLGAFESRLEESEGGRVDFVVGAVVSDEGAVGEHRQAAFEFDVFAADVAADFGVHFQLGQFFLAADFERTGEDDVDFPAFLAFGVDVHREVQFATFDTFEAGAFDDLLRVVPTAADSAVAAAAGGKDGRQGCQGREQSENSETTQGKGLLGVRRTGPEREFTDGAGDPAPSAAFPLRSPR